MMEDDSTSVEPRLLVDEASILPSLVLGAAGAVGGMASLALTYVVAPYPLCEQKCVIELVRD